MGRVICIAGSHAVGKTTLIKRIKSDQPNIDVIDGYMIDKDNLNLSEENDYIEYEMRYIKRLNREYDYIKNSAKDCIVIRSFEDTLYYLEHQDSVKKEWNLNLVKEAGKRKSDLVIFLDATIETLKKRAIGDGLRDLKATIEWYDCWHDSYVQFWKNIPYCITIKTDGLSPDDVYRKVMEAIEGEKR